ncbi:MAG: hypothetical protein EOP06_01690 [Proteobacteria bacterium]|nr:MAG: hypothetical protein EOP06_01690 [Pseudomonadota bacterium]
MSILVMVLGGVATVPAVPTITYAGWHEAKLTLVNDSSVTNSNPKAYLGHSLPPEFNLSASGNYITWSTTASTNRKKDGTGKSKSLRVGDIFVKYKFQQSTLPAFGSGIKLKGIQRSIAGVSGSSLLLARMGARMET